MQKSRGHWSSRLGFVLAAAGSAIGLGNLWKFPYITWHNEGGAFVLVYLLCIAAVGFPIMVAEILVGRKTQRSAVGALREAVGPAWGVVGGWGVLTGFVILSFYTVVAGWTLSYFWRCMNWTINGYPETLKPADVFGGFIGQGWLQVALAAVFMAITMAVIFRGVGQGIERIARVLLPTLMVILVILMGSALTMEGAGEALAFIFAPTFSELPWGGVLEALGHSFFTLSLGMGAMITYGSYLKKNTSVVRSAGMVVVLDTVIALAATVTMFSVIFSKAGMAEQISRSTAGMLFITLPELFYTVVPMGAILAPLFYLLVGFAALTSTISLLEVVVAYFIDERGWSRKKATTACGLFVYSISLLCALSLGAWEPLSTFEVFQGKAGVFNTLDHLAANWMLPTGGFLITLAVGWFLSRKESEAELMDGTQPGWFSYGSWRIFIRYISPAAVAAIILAVIFLGADFT
ncbi:MAG: sodium-dependent transporter [Acidobacteriota bacterium]